MRKCRLLLLALRVLFALDVVGSYAVSASSTSSLAGGRVCRDPRLAEPCPGGGDACEMHFVHQVFLPMAAGAPLPLSPEWLTPWTPMRPAVSPLSTMEALP